jgi:excinuclease ABC subunit A
MSGMGFIRVKGARVHNLKNIDVSIPRDQLVVLTGLSGSGKSSLAFDTIYAEGQRRYVESLSSYARQFLEMQDKPDVDLIEGLSPAISIEQKTTSKNPRSTVATVTEIYDYLRLFYARVGKPFCYNCGDPIEGKSATQIIDEVLALKAGSKISILSPIIRERKGEYRKELEDLRKQGFARVRVDGEMRLLDEDFVLGKNLKHSIDIVVDRVVINADARMRIADAVELALRKSDGLVVILTHDDKHGDKDQLFSEHFSCKRCGISYPEIEPRTFSFNAPQGACETCSGLGQLIDFDPQLVVANPDLSLKDGAIVPWSGVFNGYYFHTLKEVARDHKFSVEKPFKSLSAENQKAVLYGSKFFEGVIPSLRRRHKETESEASRENLEKYMTGSLCPTCKGARLRKEARFIKIADHSIDQLTAMSVGTAKTFVAALKLGPRDEKIAAPIIKEIGARLEFLNAVGLEYLTLDRSSGTLSGGEAQRIRLATQIGSALVGVLYVLDEPSIGLHQRDNERLLNTLRHLRDLGNCVLVVEHDEETILAADHVIDMGPLAGRLGGEIIAQGTPADIMRNKDSLTGRYLSRKLKIDVPEHRRAGSGKALQIIGARGHNLQNVTLNIPLGNLVCVTGVSGSGKSSLVVDTLHKALAQAFHESREKPLPFKDIQGLEFIDKVIDIDQSPIGRTPRSNPVTYAGVFDDIRKLFSELPDAKIRGYDPGRFSFNVKGGRCESCAGGGVIKIEMNFLPDVYVTCEVCKGKRFNFETLSVLFKGKSISDVLDMTIDEGREFFGAIPSISRKLETIQRVGLGYIHLGQQATTLSGGEAQRIKLSKELSKRATGKTLYILDEPTTGLHFHDVKHLIEVLNELVDQGNTVLVIEHNLDVIKVADHVIDLGPEGGDKGGEILVEGTPETVAKHKKSHTGRFLREILERDCKTLEERKVVAREKKATINQIKGSRAKKSRINMGKL